MGLLFRLKLFDVLDSTNLYAHEHLATLPEGSVIQALHQTAGRGQRGSVWTAPPGDNLLVSIVLKPTQLPVSQLWGLSQVAALAVWHTAADFLGPQGISIKWPNDVLVEDRKLAGLLIETQIAGSRIGNAIVGIGLNVNQTVWPEGLARAATSLAKEKGENMDLDAVRSALLRNLGTYYERLRLGHTQWLADTFHRVLFRRDQPTLFTGAQGNSFTGTPLGTTPDGQLRVMQDGTEKLYAFKEIHFAQ